MPRKSSITPEEHERRKAELLGAVKKLRGLNSFADIAKLTPFDPVDLRKALNELLEEGFVIRHGQKRGARYMLGEPAAAQDAQGEQGEPSEDASSPAPELWLKPGVKYTIAEAARYIHEQFGKPLFECYKFVTEKAKAGEIKHLRSRDEGNRYLYFMD